MTNPHPESRWTHAICTVDYERLEPGRTPARVIGDETQVCCWCGADTDEGIWYRADPKVIHADS